MDILFKKLHENAVIPTFGNNDSENAGLDFYAIDDCVIPAHGSINIKTGIAWQPSWGEQDKPLKIIDFIYKMFKPVMIIKGRSGLALIRGIECCSAGIIDSGYRGEIIIKLHNTTSEPYMIYKHDRIAQGVVVLLPKIKVEEVSDIESSARGENGLGSTGL